MSGVLREGRVIAFERQRGLGEIQVHDGAERFPFHATQLVDGLRAISIEAHVTFVVAAGPAGHWEATQIEPVEDSLAPR